MFLNVGLKKKHVSVCVWVDFEKKKKRKKKQNKQTYVVFRGFMGEGCGSDGLEINDGVVMKQTDCGHLYKTNR